MLSFQWYGHSHGQDMSQIGVSLLWILDIGCHGSRCSQGGGWLMPLIILRFLFIPIVFETGMTAASDGKVAVVGGFGRRRGFGRR